MSFIVDLKNHLESATTFSVYPIHIPQGSALPAIQMDEISSVRDHNSDLDKSNIKRKRIQLTIVTNNTKQTLDTKELIELLYENFSGFIGTSNILIARVETGVSTYDKQTLNFEFSIDIIFKILL